MLIKRDVLEAIKIGDITLQFRRWSRASVKPGGTLKTAVGILNIGAITELTEADVELADVRRAGFADMAEFTHWLSTMKPGYLCKIELSYGGEDPLIALRNQDSLSISEVDDIKAKLAAIDKRSAQVWTHQYLSLIGEHPGLVAQDLADKVGKERAKFKSQVNKLKALGLTVSLDKGYDLSPRGKAYVVNASIQ